MTEHTDTLNPEEETLLQALVRFIIPASETYRLPAADEPLIFRDILATSNKRYSEMAPALAAFSAVVETQDGGVFTALDDDAQRELIDTFRSRHASEAFFIANITTQCYYRDDRVMRTLDMEARAPFPKGQEAVQGDWSLLDPVRNRDPFYVRTDS